MGYRAHTITQHREYGSSAFWSFGKFEKYWEYLYDNYQEEMISAYSSETEEYYEIPRVVFTKEIERLKQLSPDDINEILDVENKYIIEAFTDALDESPEYNEYVAMEWF